MGRLDAYVVKWWAEPRTTPGGQAHYSDLAIETGVGARIEIWTNGGLSLLLMNFFARCGRILGVRREACG